LDLFDSIPKVLDFLPSGLNENETRRSPRKRNCAVTKSDSENHTADSEIPEPPKLTKKKKSNDKSIYKPSKTQKKQKRNNIWAQFLPFKKLRK
jgi:hypothetical protein